MEDISTPDSIIVASKIIHPGMLHGLANGGEVVIEGRWGVRCVHKNGFLEMSIITYGKEPKFKYQKFYKPTTPKKSIVPQTNQSKLVVEDGGDIFENL